MCMVMRNGEVDSVGVGVIRDGCRFNGSCRNGDISHDGVYITLDEINGKISSSI